MEFTDDVCPYHHLEAKVAATVPTKEVWAYIINTEWKREEDASIERERIEPRVPMKITQTMGGTVNITNTKEEGIRNAATVPTKEE